MPDLVAVADLIPYLQIFADQVSMVLMEAGRRFVQKCTVEGYICSVAHIFAVVVAKEPRLDRIGKI